MFNAGWILPPDQKRGGRASAMDRSALPPPRKRPRTDQNSRLSMVSTAASDNLTLLPLDPIEAKHNPNEPTDIPMDIDVLEDDGYQGHSNPQVQHRKVESVPRALSMGDEYEEEIERPHNVVKQPNGVVIIEKLDTPATRREKNLRRKAEKQKMAVQADKAIRLGDDESELSELSDLASEEPDKAERIATAERKDEGDFPGGTLVWAKADSYPWWPAVVHTPTSPNVPRNIYQAWLNKTAKRNTQLFIVQFYDKQESWQSVAINKLELLGEDPQLDEENLTLGAKQKWKPSASKQQCREAYQRAMSEMIQSDDGETSVDNDHQ